jgi:hypothetical protein
MDERDMEEKRKDRETDGWGIERKMIFLDVFSKPWHTIIF